MTNSTEQVLRETAMMNEIAERMASLPDHESRWRVLRFVTQWLCRWQQTDKDRAGRGEGAGHAD